MIAAAAERSQIITTEHVRLADSELFDLVTLLRYRRYHMAEDIVAAALTASGASGVHPSLAADPPG